MQVSISVSLYMVLSAYESFTGSETWIYNTIESSSADPFMSFLAKAEPNTRTFPSSNTQDTLSLKIAHNRSGPPLRTNLASGQVCGKMDRTTRD
jgi:hypothetical protein